MPSDPPQAAEPEAPPAPRRLRLLAGLPLALALAFAGFTTVVQPGEAVALSLLGGAPRIVATPGLALRLPPPLETATRIDLRLHVTESPPVDAETKDDARVTLQGFVAWRVAADPARVALYARALSDIGGDPAELSRQIGVALRAAVRATAGHFELSALENTDATKLQRERFDKGVEDELGQMMPLRAGGITVLQAGLQRLTLVDAGKPAALTGLRAALAAEGAERIARAEAEAAEIRANAARDARIAIAEARAQAAATAAGAARQAATIEAQAYNADPDLYLMLRSLDSLGTLVGPNTKLVLRTDAAPFNTLVLGPPTEPLAR